MARNYQTGLEKNDVSRVAIEKDVKYFNSQQVLRLLLTFEEIQGVK